MSNPYWLTGGQVARLRPYFPKWHGRPRVDVERHRFRNRNGLLWRDAPSDYGPHKTLHNR